MPDFVSLVKWSSLIARGGTKQAYVNGKRAFVKSQVQKKSAG